MKKTIWSLVLCLIVHFSIGQTLSDTSNLETFNERMILTSRIEIPIHFISTDKHITQYETVENGKLVKKAIRTYYVYSVKDSLGRSSIYSHRSFRRSKDNFPNGKVYLFDQNGLFLDGLTGISRFYHQKTSIYSEDTIVSDDRYIVGGLRVGTKMYFTTIPRLYSVGFHGMIETSVETHQQSSLWLFGLKLGYASVFRLGNHAALEVNGNFGITVLSFDWMTDTFISVKVPGHSAKGINLGPEIKLNVHGYSVGVGYEKVFTFKDDNGGNFHRYKYDKLGISVGYKF